MSNQPTKNTSDHWDSLWQNTTDKQEDRYTLEKEKHTVRWEKMLKHIKHKYKNLKDKKAIELGAGLGTYSALMAKQGINVDVLDYSPIAIIRAKAFYKHNQLSANFIEADALKLPKELHGKYDISVSIGTAEHFLGKNRYQIIKSHFDVLKPGGLAFVSVPNKLNIPYITHKWAFEQLGLWPWGEEYPFTPNELLTYANKLNTQSPHVFGESFYYSLNFINPIVAVKKALKIKTKPNLNKLKPQPSTFLDDKWSYAITLVAQKPK